jgi:hypothetical protein
MLSYYSLSCNYLFLLLSIQEMIPKATNTKERTISNS